MRFPLSGWHKFSVSERQEKLLGMVPNVREVFAPGGLSEDSASAFIENCIGSYSLPIGVATNFKVNGKPVLVPMVVEESSVLAAASHGAKLALSGGGFFAHPVSPIATAQVEFFTQSDDIVLDLFPKMRDKIAAMADTCHPKLLARGGGVKNVSLRHLAPGHFALHIDCDTREAMGANIVNTIAEEIGVQLPSFLPCIVGLRILTNLTTHRLSHVYCEVTPAALERSGFNGEDVVAGIVKAWDFAYACPFRATTHNKGVMNGIDPVVIATGNDWRAVEAGCHAFAALSGVYRPLTTWSVAENGNLRGELVAPIAVGTVGGVTRVHPGAQACLKILGNPHSTELSQIIAAVGLAQNLAALRALACEGIQRGHMALHQSNIDMQRRQT